MKVTSDNRETVHTYIAIFLICSGVVAFFTDLVLIKSSGTGVGAGTLTYIGEAFTLAGGLLGIVQYVNGKFDNFARKNGLKE